MLADGLAVKCLLDGIQAANPFPQVFLADMVDAVVAHRTHQVGLGFAACHLKVFLQQAGKHFLDHILGLGIIDEQSPGQMDHLAIMLPE